MTYSFYYTTTDNTYTGTGTYYNSQTTYSSPTTTSGNGRNTWDHIYDNSGTTCSSPYCQSYFQPSTTPYLLPSTTPYYVQHYDKPAAKHKLSGQELLEQQKVRAKELEIAEKAKIEAKIAEEKARSLLLEYVDNENRQRLLDKKPLEIPSRLFGDVKYQIPILGGRIKALKENKIITELCLTLSTPELLPSDDIVLTKLLHTLHDEENMLRTAKHWNVKEDLMARLN